MTSGDFVEFFILNPHRAPLRGKVRMDRVSLQVGKRKTWKTLENYFAKA